MKKYALCCAVLLLLGTGCMTPPPASPPAPVTVPASPAPPTPPATNPNLRNLSLKRGAAVASPFEITGEARNWYFEGSFPIKLYDPAGHLLASTPAQAQGDWMTQDFVPFKATLSFVISGDEDGTLVLKNDNPSGDPSKDQIVQLPVHLRFSAVPVPE